MWAYTHCQEYAREMYILLKYIRYLDHLNVTKQLDTEIWALHSHSQCHEYTSRLYILWKYFRLHKCEKTFGYLMVKGEPPKCGHYMTTLNAKNILQDCKFYFNISDHLIVTEQLYTSSQCKEYIFENLKFVGDILEHVIVPRDTARALLNSPMLYDSVLKSLQEEQIHRKL